MYFYTGVVVCSVAVLFTWVHSGSLGFTWVNLGSLEFTIVHLCSLGFICADLSSLGFNWVHLGLHLIVFFIILDIN